MKFAHTIWLTLTLLCFTALSGQATHWMGADLTYHHIAGNQYEITLKVYRDCAGVDLCNDSPPCNCQIAVDYNSNNCGQAGTVYLDFQPPDPNNCLGKDVTSICPNEESTCDDQSSPYPGAREGIFTGTVTLPGQCTDWKFSTRLQNRNGAISTIDNATGNPALYVEATLDNTHGGNSSPVFSNQPVPWICINSKFCFNHGALDPEGDSLVYSLGHPREYENTTIDYLNGYSPTQPMQSTPPLTLDPVTGDVCMTPTQKDVTIMSIEVAQYDDQGNLIGTVMRDMQITILDCNNELPEASGMNGTNTFSDTVCTNEQICFDIFGSDADAGDNVKMTWNQGIPDGSFSVANDSSPTPTATFCWTPDSSDLQQAPHSFTVEVIDDACPYFGNQTFSYNIKVEDCGIIGSTTGDTICNGDTAMISASAIGGVTPYTYTWNNGLTGAGPHKVIPNADTDYEVYIEDAGGYKDTAIASVIVDPLPTTNAGDDTLVCDGGTATLTATGADSYSWAPGGQTTPSINVSPATSTEYIVTGTSAEGCSLEDTVMVNVGSATASIATPDTLSCAVRDIMLDATGSTSSPGDTTFQWSTPNGNIVSGGNTSTPLIDAPGEYHVIVTDALSGCSDSDTVTILQVPAPPSAMITGTDTITCSSPSLTLNGTGSSSGSGYHTYSWSTTNGNITNATVDSSSIDVDAAGDYRLVVDDTVNGCTDTMSVTIPENTTPPTASVINNNPDTLTCEVNSVMLDASNSSSTSGAITYSWESMNGGSIIGAASDSVTIDVNAPGSYAVTVTDPENGCTDADTIEVAMDTSSPTAMIAQPDTFLCSTDSLQLDGSSSSTTHGTIAYSWQSLSGGNVSSESNTATPWVDGPGTYQLVITDPVNGCMDSATISVPENQQAPTPAISTPPALTCDSTTATLDATGSTTNSGARTFSWNVLGGNITGAAADSSTITVNEAGDYQVVVMDPVNGCQASMIRSVAIDTTPPPVTTSPDTLLCPNETVTIYASGAVSYEWTPGVGLSDSTQPSPLVSLPPDTTVTYAVTGTGANGCTSTDNIRVESAAPITLTPSVINAICHGECSGEASVNPDGGYGPLSNWSFAWKNSSGQQVDQGLSAKNLCAGDYTITATDEIGCTASEDTTIGQPPEFLIEGFSIKDETCYGDCSGKVRIDAPTAVSYEIRQNNGNSITSSDSVFENLCADTYTITAINPVGCTTQETAQVSSPPEVVSKFEYSPNEANIREPGIHFSNLSLEATQYFWDFGDGDSSTAVSPSHTFPDSSNGVYTVCLKAMNDSGCVDTTCKPVEVKEVFSIFVPNAFTPDGDGTNDGFMPIIRGHEPGSYNLKIFDRWGELIWVSNTVGEKWKGSVKGVEKKATSDVYVWKLRVREKVSGKEREFMGHVTLLD